MRKNHKGRKANRKVNSMPFYKLKEYIRYKALERGILVIEVPEFNTSKQCSRCGSLRTKRPSQGVFICEDCGYQINADVNGAKNILKRAVGYMLMVGAVVTQPDGERFVLSEPHSLTSSIRRMPSNGGRRSRRQQTGSEYVQPSVAHVSENGTPLDEAVATSQNYEDAVATVHDIRDRFKNSITAQVFRHVCVRKPPECVISKLGNLT
ncbi:MAG: hypothetical protein DRN91_03300 [Candidatus Alkanophagales archaeon]|nr:MAG: hypothetical protein DRN91_03300 [Candidatus Alkanophagales archaeon]